MFWTVVVNITEALILRFNKVVIKLLFFNLIKKEAAPPVFSLEYWEIV